MIEEIEKVLKALGDRSRLRIVNMLVVKPMCVCEITDVLKLSQSTVSGHLKILKEAGLVLDKKDGLWVEYFLHRDNDFTVGILEQVTETLREDVVLEKDRRAASRTDRNIICKK